MDLTIMSFTFKMSPALRHMAARFRKDVSATGPRALEKALEQAAEEIVTRTTQGKDTRGNSFDGYSESYTKWLLAKYGEARVDLTVTGTMLRNIKSKVEARGNSLQGRIFFLNQGYRKTSPGQRRTADVHQVAKWNNATRPFFGLSKEQKATITETIRKALHG